MKSASVKIENKALDDLKPHYLNPRLHPEKGSDLWNTLAGSLSYDYFDPIVVNIRDGRSILVSGHLRTKVLKDLGYTHADCVIVDYSEKVHLARMLAANKLIGENENVQLKDILEKLDEGDVSLDLAGYTEGEIETLMTQLHQEEESQASGEKCPTCGQMKFKK